jgi:DNA mismatch repair protein MutL
MEQATTSKAKIRILPTNLSNKIAAGEVVERPSSVVKELLENAIDAQAQKIIIILKQSGKELIHVIDDGLGMTGEDLVLAFERHATSKISSISDLERIDSLGFRGEALPSIASVSQIEIESKNADETLGNMLSIEAGKITENKKSAVMQGTNIRVKHLFYNTPARRNFLRSDNAELQHILLVLKRFFLGYPEILFEVYNNGNLLFKLHEVDIAERVKEVFGDDIFAGLVPLNESLGGIEISGFISRPDKIRRSRGNQFLFLNGRPINDKALSHAIFQGYGNLLSHGEYPSYCLFIEMDSRMFDINVHPTKMEVRFANDRSLYYFFLSSIRKTLGHENVIPKLEDSTSTPFLARLEHKKEETDLASEMRDKQKYISGTQGGQLSLAYFKPKEHSETTQKDIDDIDLIFWQIHRRYILSEIKSGLVIIDQHVAHERILFERVLKILESGKHNPGQQLLFPQTITLTMDDFLILKSILPMINNIGFGIKIFSGTTIVIEAIPNDVKLGREAQVIMDIIDYYRENEDHEFDANERLAAAFACKNAIKSGENLNQNQMHAIVDQLFACESPYFCPHGRPVIVTIELDELDRKFKR